MTHSILLISHDTSVGSRWTIFTAHRCTYTGQSTTPPNIWDLQPTGPTWWFISSIQNGQQIYRSYIYMKHKQSWLQNSSTQHAFMQIGILQNRCTISNSHKSTIMHNGPICHEWPRNRSAVFPNYISYTTCIPTHCNHVKPVDHNLNTHHTRISNNNDLPW